MKFLRLALRNLFRQKRRSILLTLAIAFGILFVTLINGFTGSFIENVGENFSNILAGHIFIDGVEKSKSGKELYLISDDSAIMEALAAAETKGLDYRFLTKRSEFRGSLIFEGNGVNQTIVGADWQAESYFKERIILKEGSFDIMHEERQALIISEKIARRLKVEIGDRIIVKLQTYTGQQTAGDFIIGAITIDTGLIGSVSSYANIDYVNELLNLQPDEYLTLGIYLPKLTDTDPAMALFEPELKQRVNIFDRDSSDGVNAFMAILEQQEEEEWEGVRYRLASINDVLSEVEQIVRILNVAALIILLVLFGIIMVGITNTFRMVLFERIKEIGTMRAVGMQRSEVRTLFLMEAFFLAVFGLALGYLLSGTVMFTLKQIYWGVDTPLFMLLRNGYMTFKVAWWQILLNSVVVILLTLFAAFRPSAKAAKLSPAQALATEK